MVCSREGFTVRVLRSGSAAPAGVGFVVDDLHIVTCAHVVNTALGRDQRAQDKPGPQVRVQVDFPMVGNAAGAPSRSCAVQAWVPPPLSGVSGGDVAGLVLVGEGLPGRAGPARLVDPVTARDATAGVFGYPGDPPRRVNGTWSELRLRWAVGGGVIQLDTGSESAIQAQPGFSGSPVIVADGTGDDVVLGMLAVASGDGAAKDAYAIPLPELARAWPDVVGRLTIPPCPYRGLGAFTADDAELFVGRDDEVGRLHEMVRKQPLVVVTGPSGVGKSSLVDAGLIPGCGVRDGWPGRSGPAECPLTRWPGRWPWCKRRAGRRR
jgi:Trypsin-like peptidase domain